ncbi:MAG: hypothetical protein Q8L45_01555 [Xanthomonadaceae bacterium]|nr:hypothetical protein [Xanthomonadaceae bacterium]MDP2185054.1 hypothetical protein [Xanthomonadales bacterium]MDZ4114433.1 hypothetical protein [Xanthomonadaceae bacterium]
MTDTLNAESFGESFAGMTVTLMPTADLRRELALLRAALPPSAPSDLPPRPAFFEDVLALTAHLGSFLPSSPPDNAAALRHALSRLQRSKSALAKRLAAEARRLLRSDPSHGYLWLVPSVWPLRMGMLLEGQTFPAQVRYWGIRRARRPAAGG